VDDLKKGRSEYSY